MKHTLLIQDLSALEDAARAFLREAGDRRIIAFYGPMGAGKTTFTAALCKVLGVEEDVVNSPTFALVNEYRTAGGETLYHFDFYRIDHPAEALDIGLYDYLDSGCRCLMEWPENIEPLLPEDTLRVRLQVQPDGSRVLTWES